MFIPVEYTEFDRLNFKNKKENKSSWKTRARFVSDEENCLRIKTNGMKLNPHATCMINSCWKRLLDLF